MAKSFITTSTYGGVGKELDFYISDFASLPYTENYLFDKICNFSIQSKALNNVAIRQLSFNVNGTNFKIDCLYQGAILPQTTKTLEEIHFFDNAIFDVNNNVLSEAQFKQALFNAFSGVETYNYDDLSIKYITQSDPNLTNIEITKNVLTFVKPLITSCALDNRSNYESIILPTESISSFEFYPTIQAKYQKSGTSFAYEGNLLTTFYTLNDNGKITATFTVDEPNFANSFNFNVKFHKINLMSLIPNPNYLYSVDNKLIVDSSGFTITQPIVVNLFINNELIADVTSTATLDKDIDYQEALDSNGIVVKLASLSSYTFTSSFTGTSRELTDLSGNLNVYADGLKPIRVEIGTDTIPYFTDRAKPFHKPTNNTPKVIFNDGTEETILDTNSIGYTTAQFGILLDVGDEIGNVQTLWAHYRKTFEGITYSLMNEFSLTIIADYIVDLTLISIGAITYGNKLKKADLSVKATYASGVEENNFTNYVIVSPATHILQSFDSIKLKSGSFEETFNSLTITFNTPSIDNITLSQDAVSVFNNNGVIDYSNVIATIHYQNAEWTNDVSLASVWSSPTNDEFTMVAQVLSSGTYSNLFSSEVRNNYDGTNPISITSLVSGEVLGRFVISVKNYFNSTSYSENFSIQIVAITNIKGMRIKNPKTDYKIGDEFLNKDDDTIVTIYWEDDQQNLVSSDILLRSNFYSISVYPQQKTKFINIENKLTVTVKSVIDSSIVAEYIIQVSPRSRSSNTSIHNLVAVWESSITLPNGDVVSKEKGILSLVDINNTYINNGIRYLSDSSAKRYGYIDNIMDLNIPAKVVMFDDYLPEIDGSANMELTYPCYAENEADLINNCHFGILFGANNSTNRLFVSGNQNVGNADWHTHELNLTDYDGEIDIENGNFSYIPSESIMYYGETDNDVVGYDIVSNDKLLVLKTKSDKEKTVYFRTPITVKALDASGQVSTDMEGNALAQEEFGLVKGNNSVAGISPNTILNFNGDTLFVDSDNQISGLDLTGIIGDNQRYANSRSKHIDFKLKQLDLTNCSLWSNNKYLFLSIKDVGLFVAQFEAKTEEQYEWWYLTSKNPTCFIEIDNEIYFGNETGDFVKLFNNSFADIDKIFADKDQTLLLAFNPSTEVVLCDSSIISRMKDDVSYKFEAIEDEIDYNKNIYYRVASIRQTGDCDILINQTKNTLVVEKDELYLLENKVYYLNYLEEEVQTLGGRIMDCESGSEFDGFGFKYILERVDVLDPNYDYNKNSFYLKKYNPITDTYDNVDLSKLYSAALCERLSKEVDVVELDRTNNFFSLSIDGEKLDIITYGIQDPLTRQIKAEIKEYRPVEAFYITAPMLANNINVFKTIWQITLTNDTEIASSLELGIASNKVPFVDSKTIAYMQNGDLGINFADIRFGKADFEKTVIPRTYTVSKILGMQKFICFAFKNEKGNNAVLSQMAITYTLPFPSYSSD